MSNLRESFAATHHASLEWHEHESAIDRVAAAGKCDALGIALWKARYMLEVWAYRECQRELVGIYLARHKAEGEGIAHKVVAQALAEFVAVFCPTCLGMRELVINDLRVTCSDCFGSGVRKYTNYERARMMDLSVQRVRSLENKLLFIHNVINSNERQVNYILNVELERA